MKPKIGYTNYSTNMDVTDFTVYCNHFVVGQNNQADLTTYLEKTAEEFSAANMECLQYQE